MLNIFLRTTLTLFGFYAVGFFYIY